MEDDIYEDLQASKFHKTRFNDEDASSVNTDIPSDPWFDEQDINFCTPFQKFNQTTQSNNESFFNSNELDESNLKEKEIDLYNDLLMVEDEEKRSKLKHDSEVEDLKKELEKLRQSDASKSVKISELMKENTNLKKSICSLYQTVKSEIEHKDQLLAEANRKIDNILFRKNCRTDKTAKSASSSNDIDTFNQSSHKRKRSTESPRSSHFEKKSDSSLAKAKNSNLTSDGSKKYVSDRNCPKSSYNDNYPFEKNYNQRTVLQTPETAKFSEDSRDSTETNNLFFNMIPTPLKKAFYDYEQSQIISLNRLKQSFINEYFPADKSTISNLEPTPKRPRPQRNSYRNKDTDSANSTRTNQNDKTVVSNKCNDESNSKITRSMQQDLVSLFQYKKERIPFLDKRKFCLLKEGKDLIPKNLL